ncbi:MAG TPA: hypothetical protein VEK57_23430 [Thermoanaerobaculia bacterium]|nr:hypothetical protein [Thermoanaerobaculia bacterium]
MAPTLSFKINAPAPDAQPEQQQLNDNGGNWQYLDAEATEQTSGDEVKIVAMKRDNSNGTFNATASMLTATVMYASQDNEVPEHFTIQGLHDLKSNNETGSVSSGSPRFADYVGGPFSFNFAEKVLTVAPRGSSIDRKKAVESY